MADNKILKKLLYLETILKCLSDDIDNNIIIYSEWKDEIFKMEFDLRMIKRNAYVDKIYYMKKKENPFRCVAFFLYSHKKLILSIAFNL